MLVNSGKGCEGGKQEGRKESILKILFSFLSGSHFYDFTDPIFEENNDFKDPEYWGGSWWLSSPGL